MDGYPEAFLEHSVPLLVASGLNQTTPNLQLPGELADQGILLRSELPPLHSRESQVLEAYFKEIDERAKSWTGYRKEEYYRFRIRTVGRSFLLPPRRARLPETIEPLESSTPPILHSAFSPLSPISALYPDGLIDEQWMKKHQELLPSTYACFYSITNDPNSATLQDNKLKSDINQIKAALAKSGYKTRVAVILLAEGEKWGSSFQEVISERLDIIRKGTAMDPKSIFFIPPQDSPAQFTRVVDQILAVLFANAVEYYRDLGRHAKKKRSRGIAPPPTVPPTSGTSQTLSLQDWAFRYEFKSGVFAEFRQETEAALRSFEQAYEILFGSDVLDIIPNWSPRWNEARMVADVTSIRCLRLHLWLGHTSLAVRRWQTHRDRISDFVDRRGMGTETYGWQAWEARWAKVMANLIERVEILELASPTTATLFLPPEKAVLGDRLQPWELLHHTGYWYRIAARHLSARRALAQRMSEEDRTPPDASPASRVANKPRTYDNYLCPEPHKEYPLSGKGGENHAQMIIDCLITAQAQYQARQQVRIAAEISVECAREMVGLESWDNALALLRPLWEGKSFRSEHWLDASEELLWLMRRAAVASGKADLVVAVDWELLSKSYTRRPHWHYDLAKSLAGVDSSTKPEVKLSDKDVSSFVTAAFVFGAKLSKAGDAGRSQLCISSEAFSDSVPVTLHSLTVEFEGSLRPLTLLHVSEEDVSEGRLRRSQARITERFEEGAEDDLPSELTGEADLTLHPGQTRVLEMDIPFRAAGDVEAKSLLLCYRQESFSLDYAMDLAGGGVGKGWYVDGSSRPRKVRHDAHKVHVLPRPPKMEIRVRDALDQYYANEPIYVDVELLNAEDEAALVKVDMHLRGKEVPPFHVESGDEVRSVQGAEEEAQCTGIPLGSIASHSARTVTVQINASNNPTTLELHVRVAYHLDSDPATPVIQTLTYPIPIVSAFEANYDLVPRVHPDPWPSLFDSDSLHDIVPSAQASATARARGIAQRWHLICHYASFVHEEVTILGMDMTVLSSVGGSAHCQVTLRPEVPEGGFAVGPKTLHEAQFELVAQKHRLDDRQAVSVDLGFLIRWKRSGCKHGDSVNTTTMPVGKYLILGSEPRVLASILDVPREAGGLMQLEVTIENSSSHFLTFGLSMEPSDDFAFSGAKQTTVHLLPLSRRSVTYRLLPLVRGQFIKPGLVVRDKYFQKVLRIIPTEGMKIDEEGLLVWVPGEVRDGEEGSVQEEEEAEEAEDDDDNDEEDDDDR